VEILRKESIFLQFLSHSPVIVRRVRLVEKYSKIIVKTCFQTSPAGYWAVVVFRENFVASLRTCMEVLDVVWCSWWWGPWLSLNPKRFVKSLLAITKTDSFVGARLRDKIPVR
jgi:hypothetical protein